jgi:6-pyruvoyl-tetrahydropterin synthase
MELAVIKLLIIRKIKQTRIFLLNIKYIIKMEAESGQCGNGAKCIAKYFFDKYKTRKKEIKIETKTRKMMLA